MLLPYTGLIYYGPGCGAMVDTAPAETPVMGLSGVGRLAEAVQIVLPTPNLKATRLVNAPLAVQGEGQVVQALPKGRARALLTVNIGATPSAFDNAQATLGELVEPGYTLRDTLRLMAAVLLGKVSGADANAPVFRDVNDTKARVSATTDAAGNRLSVSLDHE